MFHKSTLTFLNDLKENNHKAWFDENRAKYQEARNDFENFIQQVLAEMVPLDPDLKDLEAKRTMFRVNRDIRFSKNKTPYKINIAASLKKGGKKSIHSGYYFHLQPGDKSFAGGGLWAPDSNELKMVRQEIDYSFTEFKKILHNSTFKKMYKTLERDEGQVLVNVPKGYEKDNPAAEYLKLKSFFVTRPISDKELTNRNLLKETIANFKAIIPLNKFINRSFE